MTEAEWNACDDPTPMLEFLKGKAGLRKLRLFEAGCCRRIWHLMPCDESRAAVEAAELYADDMVDQLTIDRVIADACRASRPLHAQRCEDPVAYKAATAASGLTVFKGDPTYVARDAVWAVEYAAPEKMGDAAEKGEKDGQARLLRCMFGPLPFRTITATRRAAAPEHRPRFWPWIKGGLLRTQTGADCFHFDTAWRTATVTQLAEAIYAERAFDRMPILADALEDAGCANADILNHCRQGGEHVRGCWVVDLLTGRESR